MVMFSLHIGKVVDANQELVFQQILIEVVLFPRLLTHKLVLAYQTSLPSLWVAHQSYIETMQDLLDTAPLQEIHWEKKWRSGSVY